MESPGETLPLGASFLLLSKLGEGIVQGLKHTHTPYTNTLITSSGVFESLGFCPNLVCLGFAFEVHGG